MKLKQLIKRNKNNKGMALITVIVVIGFLAALVSILLMTTLVNFKMKSTETRSVDTFYSAEQVFDEIAVGLQRRVSDAMSTSYIEILENYNDLSNQEKQDMLQTRYYEKMWEYLEYESGLSGHQYYDVNKLEMFLKDSTKWHSESEANNGAYGAIVTAVNDDGSESKIGNMVSYATTGIVLKNIKVYYKDPMGFVSVVQSDIRLSYPRFEFAKTSMMADLADYSFIADGGFEASNNGNLNIDGYFYANTFDIHKKNVKVTDNKLMISKYDIDIKNGSLTTGKKETIWTKNINVKNSNVSIDGTVYVENDLNLLGTKGNNVTLKGEYYGFGADTENANRSSAILINGRNSQLDLRDLNAFKLSGRAYLGFSQAISKDTNLDPVYPNLDYSGEDIADSSKVTDSNFSTATSKKTVSGSDYKDVSTGESIAVKPDQLWYIVPGEAIAVDNNTKRSKYNSNPLTKQQYEDMLTAIKGNTDNKTAYTEVSDAVEIASLGGQKLSKYFSTNASTPKFYKQIVRVNDAKVGYLVYYYMLFDSEEQANMFIADYFDSNEIVMKKYTEKYINSIKYPKSEIISMPGYYWDNDTDPNALTKYKLSLSNNLDPNRESFSSDTEETFASFWRILVADTADKDGINLDGKIADDIKGDKESYQVVFENFVWQENTDGTNIYGKDLVEEYINNCELAVGESKTYSNAKVTKKNDKTLLFEDGSASDPIRAIVTASNSYSVTDENINLVIAAGDVNVSSITKFEGAILCNGKITFEGTNIDFIASEEKTRECLQFGYDTDELTYTVASILNNGVDNIYSSLGKDNRSPDNSLTGLVTYENWKKE